jgi:hypothetical protein
MAWTTDTRRDYVRPSGDLRKRWDGSGMGADRAAAAAGTARGARALRTHDGPSMTKAKTSESVIAKYGPEQDSCHHERALGARAALLSAPTLGGQEGLVSALGSPHGSQNICTWRLLSLHLTRP